MLKQELRLAYQHLRNNLSKEDLANKSIEIANNLLTLPIWRYNYYHIFLPIDSKKEVDTSFLLSILQGKDKNVVVPKISGDNQLTHYLLTDSTSLVPNKWNIPEPTEGIEVPVNKIDVVFIPLLAFDRYGNRVGYGKGFYDTFLKGCRTDVIKVGLSMFEAVDKIADVEVHDQSLEFCVTPEKVYSF